MQDRILATQDGVHSRQASATRLAARLEPLPRECHRISKKLAHGGNPVTRWMAANVAVAQDPAGNLKPAKDKSTERIDGIVAAIMAIGRAMVAQEDLQPTYQMIWV